MEKQFSLSSLPRVRWNVLDMITFVGVSSVRAYLVTDIDMTWAESWRNQLAAQGQKVTVTAILLKAIGIAQRAHPLSRTMFLPFGRRALFHHIAAGFTVEKLVDDQAAVFFGTIDAPDAKPLETIAEELNQYAESEVAEQPRLQKEAQFTGLPWLLRRLILWLGLNHPLVRLNVNQATFGLTSLGKFGIKTILGPCSGTSTFGVGSIETCPVVRNGQIEARPIMSLSLIFDQRVLDEAPAARFLQDIRSLLEGQLKDYIPEIQSNLSVQSPVRVPE